MSLSKAEVRAYLEKHPHFHVLMYGMPDEAEALLEAASKHPEFTRAVAAHIKMAGGALPAEYHGMARQYLDAKTHARRRKLLKGAGVLDFLKAVGRTAFNVAKTALPALAAQGATAASAALWLPNPVAGPAAAALTSAALGYIGKKIGA